MGDEVAEGAHGVLHALDVVASGAVEGEDVEPVMLGFEREMVRGCGEDWVYHDGISIPLLAVTRIFGLCTTMGYTVRKYVSWFS